MGGHFNFLKRTKTCTLAMYDFVACNENVPACNRLAGCLQAACNAPVPPGNDPLHHMQDSGSCFFFCSPSAAHGAGQHWSYEAHGEIWHTQVPSFRQKQSTSLIDSVTLLVNYHLQALRKFFAQAFNIVVLIYVLADGSQSCYKLLRRLLPWLLGLRDLLPIANPSYGSFM